MELTKIDSAQVGSEVRKWFEHERVRNVVLAAVGGDDRTYQNFVASVAVLVADTPELQKCSRASIIASAQASATLRLMVNKALGHAWIVPYWNKNKKCYEAQLQIGYKGYVYKFEENGWSIDCEVVTTEELEQGCFKEMRGSNPKIEFSPLRNVRRTEENIELVYACAMKPGRKPILAVMTKEEVFEVASKVDKEGIRKLGKTWQSKDRYTDYAEMCKKTAIRRLGKHVPIKSINEMSYFEAEQDSKMIDLEPMKNVTPAKSNMSAITGEEEEESRDVEIPDEFPIRINGIMSDRLFKRPEDAARYLKEQIRGRDTADERKTLIEENQQLYQYLLSEGRSDLVNEIQSMGVKVYV